jgi:hypothetical protein
VQRPSASPVIIPIYKTVGPVTEYGAEKGIVYVAYVVVKPVAPVAVLAATRLPLASNKNALTLFAVAVVLVPFKRFTPETATLPLTKTRVRSNVVAAGLATVNGITGVGPETVQAGTAISTGGLVVELGINYLQLEAGRKESGAALRELG